MKQPKNTIFVPFLLMIVASSLNNGMNRQHERHNN